MTVKETDDTTAEKVRAITEKVEMLERIRAEQAAERVRARNVVRGRSVRTGT